MLGVLKYPDAKGKIWCQDVLSSNQEERNKIGESGGNLSRTGRGKKERENRRREK